MDTSELFVKMCEQAHELQLKWEPQDGDFAYTKGDEEYSEGVSIIWNGRMPLGGFHNWDDHWYLPACHWLPRQDQLQAMIGNTRVWQLEEIYQFYNNFRLKDGSPIFRVTITWEQLWLALIMLKKFGKVWNGSAWVKV